MAAKKRKTPSQKKVTLDKVAAELRRVHTRLEAQQKKVATPLKKQFNLKIRAVKRLLKEIHGLCAASKVAFIFRPPTLK